MRQHKFHMQSFLLPAPSKYFTTLYIDLFETLKVIITYTKRLSSWLSLLLIPFIIPFEADGDSTSHPLSQNNHPMWLQKYEIWCSIEK